MLFNLDFASNTIWSCFFLLLLITDFYFLIVVVIAQIFNYITQLVIPIGIPNKEVQCNLKLCKPYSLTHFYWSLQWNNFLLYLYF